MHDLGRRSLGEELGARRVDLAVSRRRAVAERGPNNECVVDVARRHDVLLRVQLPVEQTVVARVGGTYWLIFTGSSAKYVPPPKNPSRAMSGSRLPLRIARTTLVVGADLLDHEPRGTSRDRIARGRPQLRA